MTDRAANDFARSGIVRTFQAVRLFRRLSVAENVEVGLVGRGVGRAQARREAWRCSPNSAWPAAPTSRRPP